MENAIIDKTTIGIDQLKNTELPFVNEVLHFSTNVPLSLYTDTTVVKTPECSYRGAFISSDRLHGEEYLLNFKKSSISVGPLYGVSAYRTKPVRGAISQRHLKENAIFHLKSEQCIKLPSHREICKSLHEIVRKRRSVRIYSGESLSLQDMSTILFYAQGISGDIYLSSDGDELPHSIAFENGYRSNLRTTPSGGALFPIDLYCICCNMPELKTGIYKYFPETHSVYLIKHLIDSDAVNITGIDKSTTFDVSGVSLQIVYIYKLFENSRKYGDTAMAFAFIEAGEIAQNIHLAATALNLGPCDIGGFDKTNIEENCFLDGLSAHAIHLTIIGK